MAKPYIPDGARLLDVGCADGQLYHMLNDGNIDYVGIDSELPKSVFGSGFSLVAGSFPEDLNQENRPFDVIAMLAVLEHLPEHSLEDVAHACARFLVHSGTLIITVPSPSADHLLRWLLTLNMIDGMALDKHYGFDVRQVPMLFTSVGFEFIIHKRFQLGLNNLFIFRKQ
jgi:SAM-dependent methyltransferase